MDIADSIYPGGFHSLMQRFEKRWMPFRNAGPEFPAAYADLDRNMLARLWQLAESDPVFRPPGFRMLRMVMTDKRTVFARIQRRRNRKAEAADG